MFKKMLMIVIAYISFVAATNSYVDSIKIQRELIRGAKGNCLPKYGLSLSRQLPPGLLNTGPNVACAFHCTLLELSIIDDNSLNMSNFVAEYAPNNPEAIEKSIKIYNDLCSKNDLRLADFKNANKEFDKVPQEIKQELDILYKTWTTL